MNGEEFLQKTILQARLNRMKHDDGQHDNSRNPCDWAMIAGEHMGHLLGAIRKEEWTAVEQEILHVSGPLLELHQALIRKGLVKAGNK